MRPLIAAHARTDPTVDADLDHMRRHDAEVFCVADLLHLLQPATHRHSQPHILRTPREGGPLHSAREYEELTGIREFHELRRDATRRAERGMDVQARASAAVFSQLKLGRFEPFGDVARLIHAQEEERYAFGL